MCTVPCDVPTDTSHKLLEVTFNDWTAQAPDFQRRDLSWSGTDFLSAKDGVSFNDKLKLYGAAPQKTGVVQKITVADDPAVDMDNVDAQATPPLRAGVEKQDASGQTLAADCDNSGVEAQALSTALDQPINSTRSCAKDFQNWFNSQDPGVCPIKRYLPFKYDDEVHMWIYDSYSQGVPAPSANWKGYKGFFPLDGLGWDDRMPCQGVKPQSETNSTPETCTPWAKFVGAADYDILHNFLFTTRFEVRFKYIASKMGQHFLRFFGDDDVWGYIFSFGDERNTADPNYSPNAKLVIDIGGVHPAAGEKVYLDDRDGGLGLVDGKRYAITMFHAERQCCQSNFKMYAPYTECVCIPEDGGAPITPHDSNFPAACQADPHSCDGGTFPYKEIGSQVKALSSTAWSNGIDVGRKIWSQEFCKTCKTECYGTPAGHTCTVCPECIGTGGPAKCHGDHSTHPGFG